MILRNLDDVFAENFRLGAGCREKDLIVATDDRVFERFPGEIVGHADLSAFQDKAPVFALVFAAMQLVLEKMFPRPGIEHFRRQPGHVVFLIPALSFPWFAACAAEAIPFTVIGRLFGLNFCQLFGVLVALRHELDVMGNQIAEFFQFKGCFFLAARQLVDAAGNDIFN